MQLIYLGHICFWLTLELRIFIRLTMQKSSWTTVHLLSSCLFNDAVVLQGSTIIYYEMYDFWYLIQYLQVEANNIYNIDLHVDTNI